MLGSSKGCANQERAYKKHSLWQCMYEQLLSADALLRVMMQIWQHQPTE